MPIYVVTRNEGQQNMCFTYNIVGYKIMGNQTNYRVSPMV